MDSPDLRHTGLLRGLIRASLAAGTHRFTDRRHSVTGADLFAQAVTTGQELERLAGRPTARIGIRAANSLDYLRAYFGAIDAAAVPFLIDYAAGPAETRAIVEDCGLDLLVHDASLPALAVLRPVGSVGELTVSSCAPDPARRGLDAATEVCRFTSGSSGRPKCIEFSGTAVHRAAVNWRDGTGLGPDDDILCYASLSNGLAFNTSLLAAVLAGARLHLASGLPTAGAVLRRLADTGATRLVGFPALYESLVRRDVSGEEFSRVRVAISSAAPLSEQVKRRFTDATGVPVSNYYGVAEAGPLTFAADPWAEPGLGQPLPGVILRAGVAGSPGSIEVRSESMGTRYLNAPGAFEAKLTPDGFYRTGDTGYLEAGSLVLSGRTSEVLNVGGRKIDAVEVAAVLRQVDGVDDAVVLEVDDGAGGVALGAVLASTQPDIAVRARAAVGSQLAPYKVPSLIRTVHAIPAGSSGKPQLAALRGLFAIPAAAGRSSPAAAIG